MFVVTGGGSGIGRALAVALAARQEQVCVVGRREAYLKETVALSNQIQRVVADLSTEVGRKQVIDHLKGVPLKGLIHNAGLIEPMIPLESISEAAWNQVMATNLNAPLFLTQGLWPQLKNGRVLHMGSGAAYFPVQGWGAYCVSKAALAMLTRCLQLETHHIAFSHVMPGIIDTPMQETIRASNAMTPEKLDFFKQLKHDKRLLSPETVAAFLCWLLLDLEASEFRSKEWDIYEVNHHARWLRPPHQVPAL